MCKMLFILFALLTSVTEASFEPANLRQGEHDEFMAIGALLEQIDPQNTFKQEAQKILEQNTLSPAEQRNKLFCLIKKNEIALGWMYDIGTKANSPEDIMLEWTIL